MTQDLITYRREQLYEEVWAEPVRKVAQRYGISDVGLAKICRKLRVPRPGVGYWAKLAAGQTPKRTPLPKVSGDVPNEITSLRWRRSPSPVTVAISAAREKHHEAIEVAAMLVQPHKLIAAATRILGRAKADANGLRTKPGRRCLDVALSPATFDRAMLILDAFLKAVERAGMRCEVTDVRRFDERGRPTDTGDVPPNTTRIFVDGEWCIVRMVEKYSLEQPPLPKPPRHLIGDELDSWVRWNRPIQRPIPDGLLELSFTQGFSRVVWKDGKRTRLENRVGEFIAGLRGMAAAIKAEREEAERRRQEREAADRRYYAEQRSAEEQRQRAEWLESQILNWRLARDIRSFVAEARTISADSAATVVGGSFSGDILEWARSYAERIDPLSALRGSLDDSEPVG